MTRTRSESGFVLIYAIVTLFLLAGLILAGAGRSDSMGKLAGVRFADDGQARQVARSGLLHAEAWLRAQERQPVTEFAPRRDLSAKPPIDETDDPSIGLVRSFEIAPGVWGRYTVRRGADDEPFTDSNKNGIYDPGEAVDDLDGDGRRTMGYGARDVSALKGSAPGSVWRVESEGEVFRRPRADLPLGVPPNDRVAAMTLAAEVGRAGFSMPATAALVTTEARETKIKSRVRITSPMLGIGYRKSTGVPDMHSKAQIVAPTKHAALPGLSDGAAAGGKGGGTTPLQVEEIFGLDLAGMKAIADVIRNIGPNASKKEPPITVPDGAIVVVTPTAGAKSKKKKKTGGSSVLSLTDTWKVTGRGILIVDGSVESARGIDFDGILFVTGGLTMNESHVTGMIAAAGPVEIAGKFGGTVKESIVHDPDLVSSLLTFNGSYRSIAVYWQPAPMTVDGRPLESLLDTDRPSAVESPSDPGGVK